MTTHREDISEGSRSYVEVNIGKQAKILGHREIQQKYSDTFAVVPLKQAVPGMKVRIDGRAVNDRKDGSELMMERIVRSSLSLFSGSVN